jgi:hypothetical protein
MHRLERLPNFRRCCSTCGSCLQQPLWVSVNAGAQSSSNGSKALLPVFCCSCTLPQLLLVLLPALQRVRLARGDCWPVCFDGACCSLRSCCLQLYRLLLCQLLLKGNLQRETQAGGW